MKNKTLKYLGFALIAILTFSCQDMERPAYSDFLYDGPIITILTPSPGGSTIISSVDAIAPITISFRVEDDLGIANITVDLDGQEILNTNEFTDNKLYSIDNLTQDISTGSHTLTITATDTNDVVVIETATFEKIDIPPYTPMFDGEMFYMAFDENYYEAISQTDAAVVGTPGFDTGVVGQGYKGAADSYLTFPSAGLLSNEFSATFWLKIDVSDDRAGIINIAPVDPSSPSDKPSGFGLIREGDATSQKFVLLVGNGSNATWINPGAPATIDPTEDKWVHFGISFSGDKASMYMDGELVGEGDIPGIDWTGVGDLSIMSGDPNFAGWNHKTEKGQMDELRLFNKALTKSEIQGVLLKDQAVFSMNFNSTYQDAISGDDAAVVGAPGFDTGVMGQSYKGASDSYLTFPSAGLLNEEFSTTFWLKIDASDTRSGIINIAPADPSSPSDKPSGFGLIREGSETAQKFVLLVGNGSNATWVNPGAPATIDPTEDKWVHFGISISGDKASMYMDGVLVGEEDIPGINWTGVGDLSIMSGDPNFSGWSHKTEKGQMDELYIFNKALTAQEIQAMM